MVRVVRTSCTYHCAACGLHFHSLEAFDAHRVGDHASNDPETRRRCVHPLDLDGKLVLLSEDGICRIGGPDVQVGVSVWTSDRRKGTRPWDAPVRAAEAAGGVSGA
jgi:hypothetical protein